MRVVKNKQGQLILEALLSIIILSISVTVILQSMTQNRRTAGLTPHYTKAILLAEEKLVEYFTTSKGQGTISEEASFDEEDETYQYSAETTPVKDGAIENLKTLDFNVSWKSLRSRKNISLQTYMVEFKEEE